MQNKEVLKLEFSQEGFRVDLNLSDNFQTDQPIFNELADFLGSVDHHLLKDVSKVHLTTLEKLEILCKKAREYADEESEYADDYKEVKIITSANKKFLQNSTVETILYDTIDIISDDLLIVSLASAYGVITISGKMILPLEFQKINLITKGYLEVHLKDSISLYTTSGKLLLSDLEEISENFSPFGQQAPYFWIKKENKWGLFDNNFNQIIPFRLEYDYCELISDNTKENIFIKVFKDDKCGILSGLLNITVLELDEDISDVVKTHKRSYLISRKDHKDLELSIDDLTKAEERLKNQN